MLSIKLTFCLVISYIYGVRNVESENFETNRLDNDDTSNLYNTLVYSDIADIMNDVQKNIDSAYNDPFKIREDSDENVDDLVMEYKSYIDKISKREKKNEAKSRNQRSKITLTKQSLNNNGKEYKYSDYLYPAVNTYFVPKLKEMEYILPDLRKGSQSRTLYRTKPGVVKKDISRITFSGPSNIPKIPKLRHFGPPIPSSCICNQGEFPCDCGCKECLIPFTPENNLDSKDQSPRFFLDSENEDKPLPGQFDSLYFGNNNLENYSSIPSEPKYHVTQPQDNGLNIHINVEIKLPNADGKLESKLKNFSHMKTLNNIINENTLDRDSTLSTAPFPYFDFPIPLNIIGFNNNNKQHKNYYESLHKVNSHHKKKTKHVNNNKKHKKSSQDISKSEVTPQLEKKKLNISEPKKNIDYSQSVTVPLSNINNITQKHFVPEATTLTHTNTTSETATDSAILPPSINDILVSLDNTTDTQVNSTKRDTVEVHNNFQPTDTEQIAQEVLVLSRKKRSVTEDKGKKYVTKSSTVTTKVTKKMKSEKNLLLDDQLLYWPNSATNTSIPKADITKLIMLRETQKSKLNLTKEIIRTNHTKALEQAVFGEVNWNDMDAVAPVFMSFVGKYLTGVLTFCSETICHSMKCEHKLCMHRTCTPAERQNHAAHCLGSNGTDSAASMDAIMDLPSNILFELVDILHARLRGKLFGKATLCSTTKCVTMTASKKSFFKVKCTVKEVNHIGQCPSMKKMHN